MKGNCVAISLSTTRPFFVSSVTVGCANSLSTGTSFTVAQQTNNQRAKNETTITTRHDAKEKNHSFTALFDSSHYLQEQPTTTVAPSGFSSSSPPTGQQSEGEEGTTTGGHSLHKRRKNRKTQRPVRILKGTPTGLPAAAAGGEVPSAVQQESRWCCARIEDAIRWLDLSLPDCRTVRSYERHVIVVCYTHN